MSTSPILRGATRESDPSRAAHDLARSIGGSRAALRVVFCAPEYDPDLLGPALFGEFADAPLIGCTTAGQFGPGGYQDGPGLTGFALPADEFHVDLTHLEGLGSLDFSAMGRAAATLAERHRAHAGPGRSFGLLLVDGLAMREEVLASSIHGALGGIELCGGSAGDGLRFGTTRLLVDGALRSDAATLALVRTRRHFEVFQTQHFRATERKLVVTDADPERRLVREINGDVAARGYAEAIGVRPEDLSPEHFSTYPVVVRVGGREHVRSIQKVEPDGSLSFLCAIDAGIVLSVAEGLDLVADLEQCAQRYEAQLGSIELTIGFDCILRRLESRAKGLESGVDAAFERLRACGFATYGEQIRSMHVNQTLTGVVLPGPSRP